MTKHQTLKNKPLIIALIVGAGKGERFGSELPKQYQLLGTESVFAHSIRAFTDCDLIDYVCPVIHPDHQSLFENTMKTTSSKVLPPVIGGKERQDSTRNGLLALQPLNPDYVLIHDAARPFISQETILRSIELLSEHKAVLVATPIVDTIKKAQDGYCQETISRTHLWAAQTPQCFSYSFILDLHQKHSDLSLTDDIALAEIAGEKPYILESSPDNFKITKAADLDRAKLFLQSNHKESVSPMNLPSFETISGLGFDVHQTCPGTFVTLCNVKIEAPFSLKGHSDADVGLHALCDAIYGALAEGDIGVHFPPSQQEWKNADSAIFLEHALKRVKTRGAQLRNIDLTFICEMPKIGPHQTSMRQRLKELTGLSLERISVKATTSEKLGFTGRGEGIAAQAIVSLLLPYSPFTETAHD